MQKKFIILLLVFIILPPFFYLTIKARQPESWDNWGFGSAQTMLTARLWSRDGFVHHKFFFVPSGYHKNIDFLDRPEFRFLATGLQTGGLIGNRLYYTHYPSGYLVPFGLLAKFGFQDRFWFRMLAICLSFGAAIFLFGFIYLITKRNKWIALLALFYYITSTTFLAYADSLANIAVDDFLKSLILFFSLYASLYLKNEIFKKRANIFIWILFFILGVSSYDSTFLIFFWLCGLDFLTAKKINIKKYLVLALAPISSFLVQMAQNTWYLGFRDMILDLWGSFAFRSLNAPAAKFDFLPPIIKNVATSLTVTGYFTDLRTILALPLILVLVFCLFKLKIISKRLLKFVLVLTLAGLAFGFVLPGAAIFGYQGRQLAPALLIIISLSTYYSILFLRKKVPFKKLSLLILGIIIFIWGAHFHATYKYFLQWPNNAMAKEKIESWQNFKQITDQQTVIFQLNNEAIGSYLFFAEFYADRLILPFNDQEVMLDTLDKLTNLYTDKINYLLAVPEDFDESLLKDISSDIDLKILKAE